MLALVQKTSGSKIEPRRLVMERRKMNKYNITAQDVSESPNALISTPLLSTNFESQIIDYRHHATILVFRGFCLILSHMCLHL